MISYNEKSILRLLVYDKMPWFVIYSPELNELFRKKFVEWAEPYFGGDNYTRPVRITESGEKAYKEYMDAMINPKKKGKRNVRATKTKDRV